MNRDSFTDILYAQPSFISGVARIFDLGGTFTYYNEKKTSQQADLMALKSDWMSVGNDIKYAINKFSK